MKKLGETISVAPSLKCKELFMMYVLFYLNTFTVEVVPSV